MPFAEPWLFIFCVAVLLVALGTTAGLVNNRLWVSEPLACAAFGVALGPLGFGLLSLPLGSDDASSALLREVARVTLAIAVTGAAIRLPHGWMRRHWRGMAVALGPGMLAMWAAGTAITAAAFGWRLLTCMLVAAALAPTDPVLAAPIVSGHLARRHIPANLRHAITAESAANDGLALPFVLLPILLLKHPPGEALFQWAVNVVLWQIGTALALGATLGWLACQSLKWAARRQFAEPASLLSVALALSIAALAGERVLHGDGILAAFVAGLAVNHGIRDEAEERQEHFNEALGRFFDLPVMVLFGAAIPWSGWLALGWRGLGFVGGILLLRRLPAWLALRPFMPWMRNSRQAMFVGWFGPIGVAALFYACVGQEQTGLHEIWPAVSVAIAASVLAHGVTGTPLAALLQPGVRSRPLRDRPSNSQAETPG